MKVIFIGGGPSSIYAAILLKNKYSSLKIEIYEKEDELLKKFKATGNGKCNILNVNDDENNYNNPSFMKDYLRKFPYKKQKEELENVFNLKLFERGELVYPLNESSATTRCMLIELLDKLGINYFLNEELISFNKNQMGEFILNFASNRSTTCEHLILAAGGKSSPTLGSDGKLISYLNKNYYIYPLKPSLVGLLVKEKIKPLSGLRIKALVKLYNQNKFVKKEYGEIIFKNEGLSGIVIMNMSSYINFYNIKNPILKIEPLLEMKERDLITNSKLFDNCLYPYLDKKISDFIYKSLNIKSGTIMNNKNVEKLISFLNNIYFHVTGTYGFEHSQVSNGGIDINEVKYNFESKKENNLYFLGEMLNIDGICGGYNLKWALLSAHFFVNLFNKIN